MKQKIKFESNQIVEAHADSTEIIAIAQKRGIKIPSSHLGFFKTIYAKIEEANLNGIRLEREATEKALPGLIGSQVNFEHLGAGFLCGVILDAWINEADQIEVVYSFFKSVYPDEYARSVVLAMDGTLSVSFELLSERESQEQLSDGTIRLHDIDFQGMGHLMDNPPAYPEAKIYEFASKCKERLSHIDDKELVCASVIEKRCNEVLAEDYGQEDELMELPATIFLVTSPEDNHFHIAEVDWDGNGMTFNTMGTDDAFHIHEVRQWQIQVSDGHTHQIMNDVLAHIKAHLKLKADKWTSDIYNNFPNSSFAVIEPAFEDGRTSDLKARHLPFKNRDGKFDMTNYRIALDKVNQILPVTDSITTEELRKLAKEELDKHSDKIVLENTQGGVKSMTQEEIKKIEELRAELGDFAKDVKDEDLLDETVVSEIRKAMDEEKPAEEAEAEEAEAEEAKAETSEEASETPEQDRIKELEAKVEELENTLEATKSEVEAVRVQAEKVGSRKVQLKDNEFAKDFTDEDYLDDAKVEKAVQDQADSALIAERKEELKANEYAKDFTDEDYLNDTKIELAKVKKEKDELEAKAPKEKEAVNASEESDAEDMNTGDAESDELSDDEKYAQIMASVQKDTSTKASRYKITERQ